MIYSSTPRIKIRLIACAVLAATLPRVGPADALQIQDAGYDFWHQDEGRDWPGVIRLSHFDYEDTPTRVEVAEAPPEPATAFYEGGTFDNIAARFQTAVVIDREFLLTTATPMLDQGLFQVRIDGVNKFIYDWWVPGGINASNNPENIVLMRLLEPLPVTHQVIPVVPPGFVSKGLETEIVSLGATQFSQPATNGDGGDGDGDGEAGFAGGFRRSGFNKFDVTELADLGNANFLLAIDQDPPFGGGGPIEDMRTDLPVTLEASLNGNDAGAVALVGGMVAGVANSSFVVQASETNQQPRTISTFTDLGVPLGIFGGGTSWAEDIAFFLDRANWVIDDFGDLAPTSAPGWERSIIGFDIEFLREQGDDVFVFDTDITPTAFIDGVCQGMGQGCLSLGPPPPPALPFTMGDGMSPAQAAALATLAFFQEMQDAEVFGEDAQIGFPVGGTGMFTNANSFDYQNTGGTVVLPIDFTGVGDLGDADVGIMIDYNRDDQISGLDIDALYSHLGEQIGPNTSVLDGMYDLTLDAVVDQADVDVLVMGFFGTDYGDVNLDGLVNHVDKATLEGNLDSPGGWESGDVDGSGVVDATDLAILLSNLSLLLGDANNDGVVTANDLLAVQQNFGGTGDPDGLLLGDANDDGVVTADDLLSAQQNFGTVFVGGGGANGGVSAVPEPASGVLMLAAAALSGRRRRG